MSLNWREIDAVLAELDLAGSYVQQVIQPDFRNLYLEIFRPGRRFYLRICLETGRTRIHSTDRKPRKPSVRQRFAQLLHSRIKGARIEDARQLNADRIVGISLVRAGETTVLWIRLWGGAANCIATDEDGNVLDAFFRRPKKGEISGGSFSVEEVAVDVEGDPRLQRFTSRWTESVDESVRRHYGELETTERRNQLIETAAAGLRGQEAAARRRLADLRRKQAVVADADRYQTLGDL
ncbi:MAG: NFACT family protein, partial [Spirochaetota bacterium]